MFFPKLRPADMVGQSMRIAAALVAVALVPIRGAVLSGPIFREGNRLFVLQSRRGPTLDESVLEMIEIPETDSVEVATLAQQNEIMIREYENLSSRVADMETERAKLQDSLQLAEGRYAAASTTIADQFATIEQHEMRILQWQEQLKETSLQIAEKDARIRQLEAELAERLQQYDARLFRVAELERDLRGCEARAELAEKLVVAKNEDLEEMSGLLATADRTVARYTELVGPLDDEAPQGINAEIAEQLKLIETEATAPGQIAATEPAPPPPPPVVGINGGQLLDAISGGFDPLATGWSETVVTPKTETTIRREGSHTDEHFRRLLFLTGGDI